MIKIQDTNLRAALSYYNELHYSISALNEDLAKNHPIEDIILTTKFLYDQIEYDFEYSPSLPKAIDEIRYNQLNLNSDEVSRYNSYVKRYVADHDATFFATIVLLRTSLLSGIGEYKGESLRQLMYDQTYHSKNIETPEDAKECLKYAQYYFLVAWEQLKQTIDKELTTTFQANEIPSKEVETPERLTTKQGVLLLEKTGWFEIQNTEEKDKTKVAKVIAALLGRNYKNVYDAIREKRDLENNRNDLKRVSELLYLLGPAK